MCSFVQSLTKFTHTMSKNPYYYYGSIGSYVNFPDQPEESRKHTIIQSLWTRPITDKKRLKDTLFLCALSLECAHRCGYKVNMHTDNKGMQLLKTFGYDELLPTLQDIPASVPTELFAAGKWYAMFAEGFIGKIHMDVDIFLKKEGLLDRFYEDPHIDGICQMEEDMSQIDHTNIIIPMHILGYPSSTRPNWRGSMNTGIVGFNSPSLATKYMNNYGEALRMYTQEQFDKYKAEYPNHWLAFDFILEQVSLSYLSLGYNMYCLLPTKEPSYVADEIGYQHEQGANKWSASSLVKIKSNLNVLNHNLYVKALAASHKVDKV